MSRRKKPTDDEQWPTTGHEWDGIREYDKPMPRWWVITFYITIVWAIGYMIAYPAWPLIKGATPGLLGYSSRLEVEKDIARVNAQNAEIDGRLLAAKLSDIGLDEELRRYATAGGAAVFRNSCAQCHGEGAAGTKGYPNLLDDDWLWGGDLDAIYTTVSDGIRSDRSEDTRFSQMPAFGEFLEREEIAQLAQQVLSLSGQEFDATLAAKGQDLFDENCSACHGAGGTGDVDIGAPDLTDAIWLYAGDAKTITETITNSRYGVMPAWRGRLTEAQIRQVTTYVHQLGGGE
jgi:cytochrome c oxidase cbb3-type subunit III